METLKLTFSNVEHKTIIDKRAHFDVNSDVCDSGKST